MSNHDPTDFVEANREFNVEHMTEEFGIWNTLATYRNYNEAVEHAKDYAKANPNTEVRITSLEAYNY